MTHANNVHAIAAEPEKVLIATLVQSALVAVKEGDHEAAQWIRNCSSKWLPVLTPSGTDPESVHQRLIEAAKIGEPT